MPPRTGEFGVGVPCRDCSAVLDTSACGYALGEDRSGVERMGGASSRRRRFEPATRWECNAANDRKRVFAGSVHLAKLQCPTRIAGLIDRHATMPTIGASNRSRTAYRRGCESFRAVPRVFAAHRYPVPLRMHDSSAEGQGASRRQPTACHASLIVHCSRAGDRTIGSSAPLRGCIWFGPSAHIKPSLWLARVKLLLQLKRRRRGENARPAEPVEAR